MNACIVVFTDLWRSRLDLDHLVCVSLDLFQIRVHSFFFISLSSLDPFQKTF